MKRTKSLNQVAFFDCSAGIAGNMLLGALIDAGLSINHLKKELKKLPIKNYKLFIKKVRKHGIAATLVEIDIKKDLRHKNVNEIFNIIKKSKLAKDIKHLGLKIFKRLADAEAKIHARKYGHLHLHELGSIDTIVDIVGTVIGLKKLGIKKIYSSALHVGKGVAKYAHGLLPIPSPATTELLKGISIYNGKVTGELVTPTGAAIISTLATSFTELPKIEISKIGYGAGTNDYGIPNLLRIVIGKEEPAYQNDYILQIETNIDDMDPQKYDRVIKKLMQAGALDAWVTPIRMKKKRTGFDLCIMANVNDQEKILEALYTYTTTIGARTFLVKRSKLKRKIEKIKTKYGKLRIKISSLGNIIKNISVEQDDCKRAAQRFKIPITQVFKEGLKQASSFIKTL